MLASTILPSGATSSTGLGSALRMASLSDGIGRRCSAAERHAAALHAKSSNASCKRAMHAVRIVRCQNLLPPGLQRRGRRAAASRRDLERPAEMFARMAQADAQAVVAADLVIERADIARAARRATARLRRRRYSRRRPIWPGSHGWPCAPRPIITASAPDMFERGHGLFERGDVAVDDERNRDRILDGAHRAPIGLALVELAARAAMHGDHLHAGSFRAARQLRRVERAIVPAEPHLQRHRHLHRGDRRLDQASARDRDRASAPSRTGRRSRDAPGSPY